MKVLIVGGGITGLALAAFLERCGVEYEVAERQNDWARQGFLISIWDPGRDILKKLGLADQFDALGSRIRTYQVKNGSGKVLRTFNFSKLYADFGGVVTVLRRSDLHELLLHVVPTEKILMNMPVTKVSQNADAAHVEFADGTSANYDVVVAADGVHSAIRASLFGDHLERYEDWRAWYVWIDNDLEPVH